MLIVIWFDLIWFLVVNATLSNISAISWRPVLVVEEVGVPRENQTMGKQLVNFITINFSINILQYLILDTQFTLSLWCTYVFKIIADLFSSWKDKNNLLIMATSFSGGRSWSTQREPDHGQATGKLYHLQLRVECRILTVSRSYVMASKFWFLRRSALY
jgi:hypothetical protein